MNIDIAIKNILKHHGRFNVRRLRKKIDKYSFLSLLSTLILSRKIVRKLNRCCAKVRKCLLFLYNILHLQSLFWQLTFASQSQRCSSGCQKSPPAHACSTSFPSMQRKYFWQSSGFLQKNIPFHNTKITFTGIKCHIIHSQKHALCVIWFLNARGRLQRKTWCMGHYAGVDYDFMSTPESTNTQPRVDLIPMPVDFIT